MKILVACEYSGTVRDAFIRRGHDAMSCDILPTDQPGPHYQGNVLDVLGDGWDMVIAHPPCTYLCVSGLHWNKRRPGRAALTDQAEAFFMEFTRLGCKWAIENPVGCMSTRYRKPDQYIQPYQFGNDASKKTGLWLNAVPNLVPTGYVRPRIVDGKKRWGNQADDGQNRDTTTGKVLAWGSDEIKTLRNKTYQGIADAMAEQWG